MKEEIKQLLEKARKSLDAAEGLIKLGHFDFSVSRSYYTMLYAAEALLLSINLSFKKHSAIIGFFGKEFIKSKKLPEELHDYLIHAFKDRQQADYESIVDFSEEEAWDMLKKARTFLDQSEQYLEKNAIDG